MTREANKHLKQHYLILCTTENDPSKSQQTCFGHGYSHARMWAQYAANHRGVCLVFERQALHEVIASKFANTNVYYGSVTYTDRFIDSDRGAFQISYHAIESFGLEQAVTEHISQYYGAFFLRKLRDWETEREYRWIIGPSQCDYAFVSIENSLSAILVGIDFPRKRVSELINLVEGLGIYVGEMKWPSGFPVAWTSTIYNPKGGT